MACPQSQSQSISVDEAHTFVVDLKVGQVLEVEVEQLSGDISLTFGSSMSDGLIVDHESNAGAVERLTYVAKYDGRYRLTVETWMTSAYRIDCRLRWEQSPEDRLRDLAERTFAKGESLSTVNRHLAAAAEYQESADLWRRLRDDLRQARALYRLAKVLPRGTAYDAQKMSAYSRAEQLYQQLGAYSQQARCLQQLGKIASQTGDFKIARIYYSQSLSLWQELENLHEISVLAYELARVERRLGFPEAARRHLLGALEAAASNVTPFLHEARVRTELGALYQYRGQTKESIQEMRGAVALLDQAMSADSAKVERQRARTLTRLGNVLAALEDQRALTEAATLLEQARALRSDLGERAGIASTANSIGLLYERMNRPEAALSAYEKAEEIFLSLNQDENATVVHGNRCRIVERLGRLDAAHKCYLDALEKLQVAGFRNATAQALFDLAKNARRRNDLEEARQWIDKSLELVEAIRGESMSSELRASFMDRKYGYYELAIEIALDLHAENPKGGYLGEAFRYLEGARARSFLESMTWFEMGQENPAETEALRVAIHRAKIATLAEEEESFQDYLKLEKKLNDLLGELQSAVPKTKFIPPEIQSLEAVQELLDSETLLLEYFLGQRYSAVWAFTDSHVVWRQLPPKAQIEATARELYESLRNGPHRIRTWNLERLSRKLSEMILAPIADLLDRPKLALVLDGALRYIPFAALPHPETLVTPDSQPEPLLLTHVITSTPSASVLAALRSRKPRQRRASDLLALVAAPAVQREGDAIDNGRPSQPEADTTRRPASLPYAKEEAEAIIRLTEGWQRRVAIGKAATREFVFSGALSNAHIVHFATHGHLDDLRGELSGLMLSQLDLNGQWIDGFLWAYEIQQLNLVADLVVLSACETALGEVIRGEGLVGLSRSFLHAGARQVVVSLWRVRDKATARLMESFYRQHLLTEMEPPEALQQAQIELRSSGFSEPFYWAGFVLEGDWAPERARWWGRKSDRAKKD